MNVAIIPARGGSKRIPKKNIKLFAGKPLISYSIAAALKCGLFDKVAVSTDSPEIAELARSFGAETPFMRPPELSGDFTPNQEVLSHAYDFMKAAHGEIGLFGCIYSTAPFIRAEEIRKAQARLQSTPEASSIYAVASFPYPILRAIRIKEGGFVEMLWPEHELTRSNELPECYHDAGQFYLFKGSEFEKRRRLIDPFAIAHVLPRFMVQDIDTEEDWHTAELLFETARQRGLI